MPLIDIEGARRQFTKLRVSALSVGNDSTRHVLPAEIRDIPADDPLNDDLDFERMGRSISSGSLPPKIVSYLGSFNIASLADHDTQTPKGAFWDGEEGARRVLRAVRPIIFNTDWLSVEKQFPGLGVSETENAEKICRLDGLPTGVWVNPTGWLQRGREGKFKGSRADPALLRRAVQAWLWLMNAWKGKPLPFRHPGKLALLTSAVAKEGSYRARMKRVAGDRHKGFPSHGTGVVDEEIGHSCNLGVQIADGVTTFDEVNEFFRAEVGVGTYLTQFFRFQGGRSEVITYRVDPTTGWPRPMKGLKYWQPKTREILAAPMWHSVGHREPTGVLTDLLKSTPFHQTLPELTFGYITAVCQTSGRHVRDWISLDRAKFDQSFSTQLFQAVAQVSAEQVAGFAPFVESLMTLPVMYPAYQNGYVGFEAARDRGMPSGIPETNLWDSLANGAVHLASLEIVTGRDVMYWARDLLALGHGFACSGDDTVALLPKGVDLDKYLAASDSMGMTTVVQPYLQFLARAFNENGEYTNIITRLVQNTLFKERRFVSKDVDIHRLGIITNRTLITAHPLKARYDDVLRAVVDDSSIDALQMTVEDVPRISKSAMRRALGLQDLRELNLIRGKLLGAEAGDEDIEGKGSSSLTMDDLDIDWGSSKTFDIREEAARYAFPWRESAAYLIEKGRQ